MGTVELVEGIENKQETEQADTNERVSWLLVVPQNRSWRKLRVWLIPGWQVNLQLWAHSTTWHLSS